MVAREKLVLFVRFTLFPSLIFAIEAVALLAPGKAGYVDNLLISRAQLGVGFHNWLKKTV